MLKILIQFSATFGGIVGLCLGGSVLSIVEIIYYATLRLWVSGLEPEKVPATAPQNEIPLKMEYKYDREDLWDAKKIKPNVSVSHQYDLYPHRKEVY